ncbi:MAG: tRNA(fMet)-specific endonuclease VapC [Sphingomonadales bacterium]|nr:tRNA(fMet)-specific endonuclease VapC [Sphingomonadales bacterium]
MAEPAYLLDSNVCIYVLADAGSAAARRLGECEPGSAVTSAIAYAEVMRGRPTDDPRLLVGAEALFQVVPVLPFDARAALRYRQIPFRRGTFDRLIAAHALALGLTLVTNNRRDYADVEGLHVENWTR